MIQRIYNSTFNSTGHDDEFMPVYITLRMVIGIFTLFVNGLTLYCIRSYDYLRTPTNLLVAGLALADFLAGFLPALLLATYLTHGGPYWIPICLTSETLKITSVAANVWFIFWIAVDRFIYISRPLRYQALVTESRVTYVLVATWIWCITSGSLSTLGFGKLHHGMSCHVEFMMDPLMYLVLFVPLLLMHWFGIITCYSAIAWIAWRQKHRVPGNTPRHVRTRDWRIVRMMAMVPGVFFICTLPCTVLGYIAITTDQEQFHTTYRICALIWWTQSWANPIIYAWKNKHYNRAFKTALHFTTFQDTEMSISEGSTRSLSYLHTTTNSNQHSASQQTTHKLYISHT